LIVKCFLDYFSSIFLIHYNSIKTVEFRNTGERPKKAGRAARDQGQDGTPAAPEEGKSAQGIAQALIVA
jgi:hypothetical protein